MRRKVNPLFLTDLHALNGTKKVGPGSPEPTVIYCGSDVTRIVSQLQRGGLPHWRSRVRLDKPWSGGCFLLELVVS